jgi:drug/metabolite transporter (DMT)-like permease
VTGTLAAGLLAAVAAACLYGSAPVAQAVAATRTVGGSGLGLGLLLRLARQWVWLLGLLCAVGGFLLEAYAFSVAPTTLVAPVTSGEVVVFVLLASAVFRVPVSPQAAAGALILCAGLALLAVAFSGQDTLGHPAGATTLVILLVVAVGLVVLLATIGSRFLAADHAARGAVAFSIGAGLTYGVAALATRQIGRTFSADDPWALLGTPTPYLLAITSILGMAMLQRGLQADPILTFPVVSALAAFVPVTISAAFLGDPIPGGAKAVAFASALFLMLLGLIIASRGRARVEAARPVTPLPEQERPEQERSSPAV